MDGYGKVLAFGMCPSHEELIGARVRVEEKIDGSQFQFWLDADGEVVCRSRSRELSEQEANKGQFRLAIGHVRSVAHLLTPGVVYRGECVSKPRHNIIAYDRVPKGFVVLWSVETKGGVCDHYDLSVEAERLGFDCTPLLGRVLLNELADLKPFIEGPSLLGGKREGIVIKRGNIRAKIVGEKFQERKVTKTKRPRDTREGFLRELGRSYGPVPRWQKAIQHLREDGKLTGTPADIGPLIQEIQRDILEECWVEIRQAVYDNAKGTVLKATYEGFPEWYKAQCVAAFAKGES